MGDLVGYQEHGEHDGQAFVTLADVWPPVVRAAIVGLNPAPRSVAAGHYYQGRAGQRQIARLVAAGLLGDPDGPHIEAAALAAGVALTDLVKRPTTGEGGLSAAEIAAGREHLVRALAARGVPLVVCVFRHPVRALLGTYGVPGFQAERTSWGARVFRMPGPFAPVAEAAAVMATLTAALDEQPWPSNGPRPGPGHRARRDES